MFGFLFKVIIMAAVIGGIGYTVVHKKGTVPTPQNIRAELENTVKNFDYKSVAGNLSSTLDNLVTNQDSKSPVVLGVKISNDSLAKVVDVLQNLPPDQVNQVRSILCAIPTPKPASSSSNSSSTH